ncbi:hypothetical protein AXF42_Ash007999 [Apostasia shenzhenica]|uniref:Uncharacterized protein n=1 Tax=Apostasia shenzhenica TaxID=1088818 RepID=A0A2I0A881_9ASPA|nr:hypothetical protein AXF42_Ash007999 [Apostasia shenzhenica]
MAKPFLLCNHYSPAMATSAGSPLRPVKRLNWRYPALLLRPRSSLSLPYFDSFCLPKPSPSRRIFAVLSSSGTRILTRAMNGGEKHAVDSAETDKEIEARGESTMPERFRNLNKEAPDRPVRWPWAIALFLLIYAWRTVLWELSNWKKAALAIASAFFGLLKLLLALVFHFIGDPITGLIRLFEYVLYYIRYMYASIVAFCPVPELTRIILLTSIVLAIAEAVVPNSVNSQPFLLMLAGITGFGAVNGFIPEFLFWLILFGMLCYSKFIKKRDILSAALPSVALLTSVGEPWVRGLVVISYLALAIAQHAKSFKESGKTENYVSSRSLPLPLLLASLAIGTHLVAKWIRYRHLTWMIHSF